MHIDFTIPFWGIIAIILLVGIITVGILAYFGEQEGGYLGGVLHAFIAFIVIVATVAITVGLILGKYVF